MLFHVLVKLFPQRESSMSCTWACQWKKIMLGYHSVASTEISCFILVFGILNSVFFHHARYEVRVNYVPGMTSLASSSCCSSRVLINHQYHQRSESSPTIWNMQCMVRVGFCIQSNSFTKEAIATIRSLYELKGRVYKSNGKSCFDFNIWRSFHWHSVKLATLAYKLLSYVSNNLPKVDFRNILFHRHLGCPWCAYQALTIRYRLEWCHGQVEMLLEATVGAICRPGHPKFQAYAMQSYWWKETRTT